MADNVITRYPFQHQQGFRERISIGREYCVFPAALTAGDSVSEEIDIRGCAGAAIGLDPNMSSATHIAIYASAEGDKNKLPVYDEDDNLLIITVEAGCIVTLPPEIFPLGYIALALCSDEDGTLTSDQSDLQFLVMLKA